MLGEFDCNISYTQLILCHIPTLSYVMHCYAMLCLSKSAQVLWSLPVQLSHPVVQGSVAAAAALKDTSGGSRSAESTAPPISPVEPWSKMKPPKHVRQTCLQVIPPKKSRNGLSIFLEY